MPTVSQRNRNYLAAALERLYPAGSRVDQSPYPQTFRRIVTDTDERAFEFRGGAQFQQFVFMKSTWLLENNSEKSLRRAEFRRKL
jgi:hypothetical protein